MYFFFLKFHTQLLRVGAVCENCPWQVPHLYSPVWGQTKHLRLCPVGVWLGLRSPAPTSGLLPMATVRIMQYKIKERGWSTKHFPFSPGNGGETWRGKRGQEWTKSLPSRAMGVWCLLCLLSTAVKIADWNCLFCEAEGQHFGEGAIFAQMHRLTCGTVIQKPESCRKVAVGVWVWLTSTKLFRLSLCCKGIWVLWLHLIPQNWGEELTLSAIVSA